MSHNQDQNEFFFKKITIECKKLEERKRIREIDGTECTKYTRQPAGKRRILTFVVKIEKKIQLLFTKK